MDSFSGGRFETSRGSLFRRHFFIISQGKRVIVAESLLFSTGRVEKHVARATVTLMAAFDRQLTLPEKSG